MKSRLTRLSLSALIGSCGNDPASFERLFMRYSLLNLIAASAVAVILCGCGDNGSTTTTPAATPPATTLPPGSPMTAPGGGMVVPGAMTVPTTQSVTTAVTAEADRLLAQTGDYMKQNKWDLAQQSVAELEKMKPNLPAEYGPRIDQLKTLVDQAKAAGGKLPAGIKF
jgi:hypothetical protein